MGYNMSDEIVVKIEQPPEPEAQPAAIAIPEAPSAEEIAEAIIEKQEEIAEAAAEQSEMELLRVSIQGLFETIGQLTSEVQMIGAGVGELLRKEEDEIEMIEEAAQEVPDPEPEAPKPPSKKSKHTWL